LNCQSGGVTDRLTNNNQTAANIKKQGVVPFFLTTRHENILKPDFNHSLRVKNGRSLWDYKPNSAETMAIKYCDQPLILYGNINIPDRTARLSRLH
jgi:hypothetical protein